MSGAWGRGPPVARAPTAAESAASAAQAAKRKAEESSLALMRRSTTLAEAIEKLVAVRDAGVSAAYGADEQYTVRGGWTTEEARMALEVWKAMLEKTVTNAGVTLNMHLLGPSMKRSGGRNHRQFNFIRKMTSGTDSRFNVHANHKT